MIETSRRGFFRASLAAASGALLHDGPACEVAKRHTAGDVPDFYAGPLDGEDASAHKVFLLALNAVLRVTGRIVAAHTDCACSLCNDAAGIQWTVRHFEGCVVGIASPAMLRSVDSLLEGRPGSDLQVHLLERVDAAALTWSPGAGAFPEQQVLSPADCALIYDLVAALAVSVQCGRRIERLHDGRCDGCELCDAAWGAGYVLRQFEQLLESDVPGEVARSLKDLFRCSLPEQADVAATELPDELLSRIAIDCLLSDRRV
jgi:hypothetical protein